MMHCTESYRNTNSYGYMNTYGHGASQFSVQPPSLLSSHSASQSDWRSQNVFSGQYTSRFESNSVSSNINVTDCKKSQKSEKMTNKPKIFENYISTDKPKHPSYAIKSVRVTSFKNFPCNIQQTPTQLAEAGFFYSGKEDVVCCFFCGQGLRSWDPTDEPWIEHAQWSPNCRYLSDVKGKTFIKNVTEAQSNPDLMAALVKSLKINDQNTNHRSKDTTDGCSAPVCHISTDHLLETMAAQSLIRSGQDRETVGKAIDIYVKQNGSTGFKGEDLMKIVFELDDGILKYEDIITSQQKTEPENIDVHTRTDNDSADDIEVDGEFPDLDFLKTENAKLKERTLCRHCTNEAVSVVFLPCGHLCCCHNCSPHVNKCLVCDEFIKATVKTYLT